MTWRYIAQRILTGEFLEWEVPLARDEVTWTLSGAGVLRGTVAPDIGRLRAADGSLLLDEWGTALYAEKDGEIRWGGIVTRSSYKGAEWAVECSGFATYPYGIPYVGKLSVPQIDVTDAIKHIWEHLQSQPDGNLGVEVIGAPIGILLGRKATYKEAEAAIDPDKTQVLDQPAEPYTLAWYDAPDCGSELSSLVTESGLNYREEHLWDGDVIRHRIVLGTPRLGRRRDDLAFVMGDNITNVVEVQRDGADFANEVVGLGAGEGASVVQARIPQRDGRLRRPVVYTDKSVTTKTRMTALARAELAFRQNHLEIASVEVAEHPNAPIGSWSLGDDVLIQADLPWLGEIAVWHRVTEWSLLADDRARLSLVRTDSYA